MSDGPTPAAEATRALRDIEQRRGQARESTQESRWVRTVFGVLIFVELAASDFVGPHTRSWLSLTVAVLLVAYTVMLRTRRGNSLLGRPTRVRRSELSPRFVLVVRLVIIAAILVGHFAALSIRHEMFPYASTVLGLLLGGLLIFFGGHLQRGMNSLAVRGRRTDADLPNGGTHGPR